MSHRVILGPRAEQQLDEAYEWYAERSPDAAVRWYNGFLDALESLEDHPLRFGMARENDSFPIEVRQLLYGRKRNWRALFTVRPDMVFIFSIRHESQREMTPDDY